MGAVRPMSLPQGASDEELIRQLAAGRQEALGPLYGRYAPLVYSLAVKSLDRPAAEEVVQDVLLAVWRAAATFDPERGAVRSWVLQIAHYRILNELRRRSRRPRIEPDPDGLRLVEAPDPDPDPAELAARQADRAAVRSALETLPPPQRQALSLAFFSDLTHEQVAAALDLPLGTAKTRIRAGLHKLRIVLAPLIAAAVVALGGLLALLGVQYHTEQETRQRDDRALRLVTTSDTQALHLAPAAAAPAEMHGSYRGRAGVTTATVSVSHAPPPPQGAVYRAWVRHGETWLALGALRPDGAGNALLIAENPALRALPDEVRLTLEPANGHAAAPSGPTYVDWTP